MPSSLALYRKMDRVSWLRTYSRKVLLVAFLGNSCSVDRAYCLPQRSLRTDSTLRRHCTLTLHGDDSSVRSGVLWTMDRLLLIPLRTGDTCPWALPGDGQAVEELPTDLHDEAGVLLRNVNHSVLAFERHRNELERSAQTDALTGLLNRRGFEARLRETKILDRQNPVCIALVDIDHFKTFNDNFGHYTGDIALQKFGCYLQTVCHKEWGDGLGLVSRWGGEEFLLLLPACEASGFLESLRVGVQSIDLEQSHQATITISAGYAAKRPEETINECIHRADEALYRAKVEGRDRVLAATDQYAR